MRREARLGQGEGVTLIEFSLGGTDADDPELPLTSPDPDQQRTLEGKEEVERLQNLVEDHLYASAILDEMKLGRTGPEIQKELGITQNEYESALKWIRNNAERSLAGGNSHAQ